MNRLIKKLLLIVTVFTISTLQGAIPSWYPSEQHQKLHNQATCWASTHLPHLTDAQRDLICTVLKCSLTHALIDYQARYISEQLVILSWEIHMRIIKNMNMASHTLQTIRVLSAEMSSLKEKRVQAYQEWQTSITAIEKITDAEPQSMLKKALDELQSHGQEVIQTFIRESVDVTAQLPNLADLYKAHSMRLTNAATVLTALANNQFSTEAPALDRSLAIVDQSTKLAAMITEKSADVIAESRTFNACLLKLEEVSIIFFQTYIAAAQDYHRTVESSDTNH
jgi:hypothetical protein